MRRVHTIIGWLFVLIFLSTGVWMRLNFPNAYHEDEALRLMFRASHIYIIAAALLNLLAGIRRDTPSFGLRRRLNIIGSILLLAAPPLLTVAFIVEPRPHAIERPLAHIGVGIAALGTVLIVASAKRHT